MTKSSIKKIEQKISKNDQKFYKKIQNLQKIDFFCKKIFFEIAIITRKLWSVFVLYLCPQILIASAI